MILPDDKSGVPLSDFQGTKMESSLVSILQNTKNELIEELRKIEEELLSVNAQLNAAKQAHASAEKKADEATAKWMTAETFIHKQQLKEALQQQILDRVHYLLEAVHRSAEAQEKMLSHQETKLDILQNPK